jgi:hypothetical protein
MKTSNKCKLTLTLVDAEIDAVFHTAQEYVRDDDCDRNARELFRALIYLVGRGKLDKLLFDPTGEPRQYPKLKSVSWAWNVKC